MTVRVLRKRESSFNMILLEKNIIDLNNIYIDEIDRSLLTTELSFIGYKGFGNFSRIFQILIFSPLFKEQIPPKIKHVLKEKY